MLTPMRIRFRIPWAEAIALAAILSLAGALRFANLGETPGWYSDEGTVLNIAQNLLSGQVRSYALQDSTLLIARMPLYPLLASLCFRIFGVSIETLRGMSAALGLLSVGLLYLILRRKLGRPGAPLALLAALMLGIYPSAILYSRLGISYNLLAPLVILSLGGLYSYIEGGDRKGMLLAAAAVGLGAVCDIMMWSLLVPVLVVVSLQRPRDLPPALALALLPSAAYTALMLVSNADAFLFDLRFTLGRLGAVPVWAQPGLLILNFAGLVTADAWILVGLLGLFILEPRRWRLLALTLLLLPLIAIGRSTGLAGLRLYYVSPLFPLLALGMGSFVLKGATVSHRVFREAIESAFNRWGWRGSTPRSRWLRGRSLHLGIALGIFLVLLGPILVVAFQQLQGMTTELDTPIDWVLVDPAGARQIGDDLNERLEREDVVIASPAFGWYLDGRVAGFQQALAAEALPSIDYPQDVPLDRFAFDARLGAADYAVVDRIWTNWAAVHMPEVASMIQELKSWKQVANSGEFTVYENPSR